jgi:hypothetical protein
VLAEIQREQPLNKKLQGTTKNLALWWTSTSRMKPRAHSSLHYRLRFLTIGACDTANSLWFGPFIIDTGRKIYKALLSTDGHVKPKGNSRTLVSAIMDMWYAWNLTWYAAGIRNTVAENSVQIHQPGKGNHISDMPIITSYNYVPDNKVSIVFEL